MNGLSLDLIVHPGETIKEIIDDRGITQEELAIKTGFSPKHVSEVVRGKKDISSKFANALEIALGIPTYFWINLQGIYDKQIIELESINNISKEEYDVLEEIKPIISYCEKNNVIVSSSTKSLGVLNARKFLGITNLTKIPELNISHVAYRGSTHNSVNVYVLYAWQKLCEYYTDRIQLVENFNKDKLIENLGNIRNAMFLKPNNMIKELQKIFASCGVAFAIVRHFTGAPVQGYIQKRNGKVTLCMTIRQAYSDIFWFTLFHEIGHLLNDDFEDKMLDYVFVDSPLERKADQFSKNFLLDENEYKKFIKNRKYSISSIRDFAKKQDVIPSIVIGRMEKEFDDYTFMAKYRTRYKWIEI
ncbi:MAG: helix-turn-helix domain-containing protein [Bacilli bacterium]|nr:helix-turn-helix domain-containing protein [Bacilli bacterium]